MNPQEPNQYDPHTKVSNVLPVMRADEQIICNIKRHPIGIITIYVMIAFLLVVVAVLAFAVAPSLAGENSGQATRIGAIIFLLFAILCAAYGLVSTYVYWGNQWVVTDDSITQVNRSSLFRRQSAQLSLASLEDVTAEQNGILPNMFKYGVLKAETAGHRSKFVFNYCPNPNFYASCILEAREAFEQEIHSGESHQQPQAYQEPPANPPAPTLPEQY